MPAFLVSFGDYLATILAVGAISLVLVFLWVLLARAAERGAAWRRARTEQRYAGTVSQLLGDESRAAVAALSRAPRRHRRVIGRLILNQLEIVSGDVVESLHAGVVAMRLDEAWRRGMASRHWWVRAEAAHALGLLRGPGAANLLPLLDDPHEQVRAATVTALGWLADPDAIPLLLDRLQDETRHQRVRIVESLQHFGAEAGPAVVAYAASHRHLTVVLADLMGQLRLIGAIDVLIEWTEDTRAETRAAAWKALGAIGLDDRGFYHALRALGDDDPAVRAMAVRALGRGRRSEAAAYLHQRLHDEWLVASEAALALRRLGPAGVPVLQAAAAGGGTAAELARQVLWHVARGMGEAA